MASVFKKGREKAERRKKFTEEAKKEVDTSKSVFKKGREKAERRKKFTKEAKKAGKKEGHRRMTKDTKEGGTLKRGRRVGQGKGEAAADESKAQLYKRAVAVKKKEGRADAISTFSKKQLQNYLLKYE